MPPDNTVTLTWSDLQSTFDQVYVTTKDEAKLHSLQQRIDAGEDVDVQKELGPKKKPSADGSWVVSAAGGGGGSYMYVGGSLKGTNGASGTNGIGSITGITSV